jgi:hypothetical protein
MTDQHDQWEWWRNALEGRVAPIVEDEPQTGFYRVRRRNKHTGEVTFSAVAYRYEDGQLCCNDGGNEITDYVKARDLWTYASKDPITHEVYANVMAGNPWPDLHEAVTRSNRAPPDDTPEAIQAAVEDLAREAETIIKDGEAKNPETADRAADLADSLGKLEKKADELRRENKKPHEEAGRAADRIWNPIRDAAESVKRRLKAIVITPWQVKVDRELAEAKRAAAAAGTPPEDVPQMRTTSGTRGRAIALRTVKIVTIEDRAAVLAFFADRKELTELLQTLAERAVKAGVEVPGTKVTEEKRAA